MLNSVLTLLRYVWLERMIPQISQVRSETDILDIDWTIKHACDQNLLMLCKDPGQDYDESVLLITQTGVTEARKRWGNGD